MAFKMKGTYHYGSPAKQKRAKRVKKDETVKTIEIPKEHIVPGKKNPFGGPELKSPGEGGPKPGTGAIWNKATKGKSKSPAKQKKETKEEAKKSQEKRVKKAQKDLERIHKGRTKRAQEKLQEQSTISQDSLQNVLNTEFEAQLEWDRNNLSVTEFNKKYSND